MAEKKMDLLSIEERKDDVPEGSPPIPSNKSEEEKKECDNPEMKEEQIDDQQENAVASEEKERSETSFMDFPDEIHIQIMEKLDVASCLKLRVNRRLNSIQLAIKKEEETITVDIHATGYKVDVVHSNTRSSFESSDFDSLEKGLRRLARSTRVNDIEMTMHTMPTEEHCRIADALLNFEAHDCLFSTDWSEGSDQWKLLHISPTNFHTISKNFVLYNSDGLICSSLTAQDFCTIRKTMLEGDCKMQWFSMKIEEEMGKSFVEACFGVTIVDFAGPLRGRMYRTADDSVELYSNLLHLGGDIVIHMVGDLRTQIMAIDSTHIISFDKCKEQQAIGMSFMRKIQLNHLYMMQ